jgi:hypothetical protein
MYTTHRWTFEASSEVSLLSRASGLGPFLLWAWHNAGRPRLGYFSTNEDKHGNGLMRQDREMLEQFKTGSVGQSAGDKTMLGIRRTCRATTRPDLGQRYAEISVRAFLRVK